MKILEVILNPEDGFLYQVNDDEIKVGDWDYSPMGLPKVQYQDRKVSQDNRNYGWRKIVSSNNPNLSEIDKLPIEISCEGIWKFEEKLKKYSRLSLAEGYSINRLMEVTKRNTLDNFDYEDLLNFTAQDIEEAFRAGQNTIFNGEKIDNVHLGRIIETLGTDLFERFSWCIREINGEYCLSLHKRLEGRSYLNEKDFITAFPIDKLFKS